MALARRLDGEIVGADSRQVYRSMDIGTAKPPPSDQRLVPHHLIDVADPDEPFGLAQYLDLATAAIVDIRKRGRLPIVVGGTGQYVWSLIEGWKVPRVPPNHAFRSALEGRAQQEGAAALHAELAHRDPIAAAEIHPNNVRRVIRALEIFSTTGQPPSALRALRSPSEDTIVYGLRLSRQEIYERIDRRIDAMFAAGFVDEVRGLLEAEYDPALPSMSGIGYAQVVQYLQGDGSLDEAIGATKTATHRLARQQATWFRLDDQRIIWIAPDEVERAVALVAARGAA